MPPWWWLVVIFFVVSLAVAVFAYVDPITGAVVTGLFTFALVTLVLTYGGARISVDDAGLNVGRFHLGAEWIGDAEALRGEPARDAIGRDADTRDFLQTRPYIDGLVRITLDDPADPHPHWLVSSRNPEELVSAIHAVKGGVA